MRLLDGSEVEMPAGCATAGFTPEDDGGVTGTATLACARGDDGAAGAFELHDCA